jgi:uncharacterized protein (DUF2147 family)
VKYSIKILFPKILFLLIFFLMSAAACFAADPAEGFWLSADEKTGKETMGWEIFIQDGKMYGRILSIAGFPQTIKAENCKESYKDFPAPGKVSELPVVGTIWIFGLVPDRRGREWEDGHIIDINDGSMYGCKITHHPPDGKDFPVETLEVRGTRGPFGRSQFWRRVSKEQASGLR